MIESFRARVEMPFPRLRTPFSAMSINARCRLGVPSVSTSSPARAHQVESDQLQSEARTRQWRSDLVRPRKMVGVQCP